MCVTSFFVCVIYVLLFKKLIISTTYHGSYMTPHKKRKKIIDDKTYTIQLVIAETEGGVVCGLSLFKIRP